MRDEYSVFVCICLAMCDTVQGAILLYRGWWLTFVGFHFSQNVSLQTVFAALQRRQTKRAQFVCNYHHYIF